jgi:hypothetical protein
MARKVDPLKAKQKKQKIVAGLLGVVLVGVLAFEVPSLMKHFNQKAPAAPVAATSTTAQPPPGTPTLAAPTLAGTDQTAAAAQPAASSDGVTSGDGAPAAQDGQLASFSRFVSKDPFAQQIQTTASGGSTSAPASSGGSTSGSTSGGSGSSVPHGSAPAPGSAVISVNGTLMTVTVGGDFPAALPYFHLVSLTAHTAQVSIVGGSYANGSATVTLHENKPLTLMNTADGTRYKLVLKPQGTPVPNPTATTTSTPTTTTGSGGSSSP